MASKFGLSVWVPDFGYPVTVSQVCSPLTRAVIPVEPPFIAQTPADWKEFLGRAYDYLAARWYLQFDEPEALRPVGGMWRITVTEKASSDAG